MIELVLNNAYGTWVVATAAVAAKVEKFVLDRERGIARPEFLPCG